MAVSKASRTVRGVAAWGRSSAGSSETARLWGREGGSAAIWVLALMALVWTFAVTVMVAGGVRAARHRAHTAADDAALAAASHAAEGQDAACGLAARIALASDTILTRCLLVGDGASGRKGTTAEVSVELTYRGPPSLGTLRIPARARSGPAPPPDLPPRSRD